MGSGKILSEIGRHLQAKIENDFPSALSEYSARPDAMGGKVLNTDVARELSPHYLADRTLSADVHEPASQFIKDVYAQKLQEAPGLHEQPTVMFTAGGTGAGKTTAVGQYFDTSSPQLIYDTNMNSYDSAKSKVQQALDAGKNVNIVAVHRDPVDALVNGALPRAMRQEAEHGTGRTVPLSEHQKTHEGYANVISQLAEEYKNDPRFNVQVIDNSHGKGAARLSNLDLLRQPADTQLGAKLQQALDNEYAQGNISKSVYDGFNAESQRAQPAYGAENGAKPQPAYGQLAARTAPQIGGASAFLSTLSPQAQANIAQYEAAHGQINDTGSIQPTEHPALAATADAIDKYATLPIPGYQHPLEGFSNYLRSFGRTDPQGQLLPAAQRYQNALGAVADITGPAESLSATGVNYLLN